METITSMTVYTDMNTVRATSAQPMEIPNVLRRVVRPLESAGHRPDRRSNSSSDGEHPSSGEMGIAFNPLGALDEPRIDNDP